MAQTAAHLVACVMPWVAMRQWVVSVPVPLRYWMASSRDLTTQVHRTVRNTIAQYYVNQAVCRGAERHKVQSGSVTFLGTFHPRAEVVDSLSGYTSALAGQAQPNPLRNSP